MNFREWLLPSVAWCRRPVLAASWSSSADPAGLRLEPFFLSSIWWLLMLLLLLLLLLSAW